MLLNRYERTATGIRIHDVGDSHIDLAADDALTLLALLLRDRDKLRNTADEAALARARKFRQPTPFVKQKPRQKQKEATKINDDPDD